MNRNKILALFLTITMCIAMLPVGVYAEDPPDYEVLDGTATVTTDEQLLAALDDTDVDHIIAESMELEVQEGTELQKDLTLASSSLNLIDNGLLIVHSGVTLTVDEESSITVEQNAELRIGGWLKNNGDIGIGGVMSAAGPAVIENYGTVTVTVDPERGFGHISLIDILSDTWEDSLFVTLDGHDFNAPDGAIAWTADVNGPDSLDFAMEEDRFTGIWLSEFHDEGDPMVGPTIGVDVQYSGNLIITKPVDIFENDTLQVNGDLTIDTGKLYIGGEVTVTGALSNYGEMFIDNSLTVTGTATNYSHYTQSAYAEVDADIEDEEGVGSHMRGYYVKDIDDWEEAVEDSEHCNPIVIAPEAAGDDAIVVSENTELTCNLIVEGDLVINNGVTLTLKMRFDGDTNGVANDIKGSLTNNGTLELLAPVSVCGTLENNGTMWAAAYNGDQNNEDWTEDGSILMYTLYNGDIEPAPIQSGLLKNTGTIINYATIAINDIAVLHNTSTGVIEGGAIRNWWYLAPENIYPLVNEGLIRFTEIDQKINYTHLAYRDLDNTGKGWYENPEYGYIHDLYCQPGNQLHGLFGLWDYNDETGKWGFATIEPDRLVPSADSGISLNTLDNSEISTDSAQDVSNSAAFVRMEINEWGDHEISYTAADSKVYRMAVTADLPIIGYYTGPAATQETYLSSMTYTPEAEDIFYAVFNVDFQEGWGWTSDFEIMNGEDKVTVENTEKLNVFKVTVNHDTKGNFEFNLKIILDNETTGAHLEPEWWIGVREAETEGLVFSWIRWKDEDSLGIQYPAINREGGGISYNTSLETGPGGQLLSFFYRHWVGDDSTGSWVYTPIAADELTATVESGIVFSAWQNEKADLIMDDDYKLFEFTELEIPSFGNYEIKYTNGTDEFALPVSVTLPEVAFYSAPEATEGNYIGEFLYGTDAAERQFYLIASPRAFIEDSWNTEAVALDGGDKVTFSATDDPAIFLVTVDPNVTGNFRLHAEIRYWDNEEHTMWQSDRDIKVSEKPVEGLVFSWTEWRGEKGSEYPVAFKDNKGNIIAEPRMNVSVGGLIAPFFYRHLVEEEWKLDPVDPEDIIIPENSGISIRTWSREGSATEYTDPDGYLFADMKFEKFGSFELSYETGGKTLKLPVTVGLPDAGFYKEDEASEENYINEFHYDNVKKSFYFIANTDIADGPDWTAEVEILDGADRVEVSNTDMLGVFLITVRDTTMGDARFHGKIRLFDRDHEEKWQSDRDIWLREAEVPGLVYRNLDWHEEVGGHFENEDWGFETRFHADPREHAGIFYTKEYSQEADNGEGGWIYTPADIQLDNEFMTISPLDQEKVYSGSDNNINITNADYYRSIIFKRLGSFTLEYTTVDNTFSLPIEVGFPGLGAFSTLEAVDLDHWLPEVRFDKYRTVYLIPTVDLSAMDLTRSTFYLPDEGEGDPYERVEKTFSKDGYGSITAHETEGTVDYFAMTISASPFDRDFDLGLRLRDAEDHEIIGTTIRFRSELPDADSVSGGIPLETPAAEGAENDTSVELTDVPAHSVRYVAFEAGTREGEGYLFGLTGDSAGTRLYLFDSNWSLLAKSNFENLSEGRAATIFSADLTPGADYYIAVHNESNADSDYELSAGLRAIPEMPVVSAPLIGSMYTRGVNVSGASEGQSYVLYARVDGQWHRRGEEPYDANNEPHFIHLFDFLMNNETAQAIGVAISSDGIESAITDRVVTVTRSEGDGEPAHIQLMSRISQDDYKAAMRSTDGTAFPENTYYRFRHETDSGEWDYLASFIGDGSAVLLGGVWTNTEEISDGGRWVLAEYRTVDKGGNEYEECWDTLVDTAREGFGSLDQTDFDILRAELNSVKDQVDAELLIRCSKPDEVRPVSVIFAVYDSAGRMLGLEIRNEDLGPQGLDSRLSVPCDPENPPATCKAFILGPDCSPETGSLFTTVR